MRNMIHCFCLNWASYLRRCCQCWPLFPCHRKTTPIPPRYGCQFRGTIHCSCGWSAAYDLKWWLFIVSVFTIGISLIDFLHVSVRLILASILQNSLSTFKLFLWEFLKKNLLFTKTIQKRNQEISASLNSINEHILVGWVHNFQRRMQVFSISTVATLKIFSLQFYFSSNAVFSDNEQTVFVMYFSK
jgi:hypothetical protein